MNQPSQPGPGQIGGAETFTSEGSLSQAKATRARFVILFLVFIVTSLNYADRATLGFAAPAIAKSMSLSPVQMGYVFSAFGWAYVLGQVPGGILLDRFGSKAVYGFSLLSWSLCTLLQGAIGWLPVAAGATAFFVLRFFLGLVESPAFPANSRITAAWFPTKERGVATSIFNSAQYAAVVMFSPIMGWIAHAFGWEYLFLFMGAIGILLSFVWQRMMHSPKDHPGANAAEVAFIEQGGGLVNIDNPNTRRSVAKIRWAHVRQLLSDRMLIGIYIGQYCISALAYFFITWLPIYLVQSRGMSILKVGIVATLPAIFGFVGGVVGGLISDLLLRRGYSLTVARKTPFVAGMVVSLVLIACNFVDSQWAVVVVMACAYLGKGLAAIGWAVIADTSPKEITGLTGGVFNAIGNVAGIVTPIMSGYILQATGSYSRVLVFVAAHSLLAIVTYLFVVGELRRVVLKVPASANHNQSSG